MKFWIIDTFSSSLFEGNPAAVCWLEESYSDVLLGKIAQEFNLHETIFVSQNPNQHFQIKWFTPFSNESVCGHGLLAAAHVLWKELKPNGIDPETIYFDTPSGVIVVSNGEKKISITIPAKLAEPAAVPDRLMNALGTPPIAVSKCGQIYIVEMFSVKQVIKLTPDISKLEKIPCNGVIITAEGGEGVDYDFASRFFAPSEGVNEDSATLWNHSFLGTYWEDRLGRSTLTAIQMDNRKGVLFLECTKDQVRVSGECITSMQGNFCNMNNWALKKKIFDVLT